MLASSQRLTSNVSRTHMLIGLFFNTTCYNHVMLTFSYKYIIVISLYSICNIGYLFFILWFYYKDFYYYYYYLEGAFFYRWQQANGAFRYVFEYFLRRPSISFLTWSNRASCFLHLLYCIIFLISAIVLKICACADEMPGTQDFFFLLCKVSPASLSRQVGSVTKLCFVL